jgi:predicted flap endonuclease-1-like 5' DNA nuclease
MVMKQKVSQATIDKIKKMGMTKALKSASNASPEMKEGLKRMYGAKRVAAATASSKPMQMTARAAERSTPMKSTSNARIADRKTPVAKKAAAPMRKKSTTTDPFARAVFGIGPGLNALQRKIGATSPADLAAASNRKPVSNSQKTASVAATNAKRMGISVAEYNKRLNAAKKK